MNHLPQFLVTDPTHFSLEDYETARDIQQHKENVRVFEGLVHQINDMQANGACMQHVAALEELVPGILLDAWPKDGFTRHQSPQNVNVAVESVGLAMTAAIAAAVAAALAVLYKIIRWIIKFFTKNKPEDIEKKFKESGELDKKRKQHLDGIAKAPDKTPGDAELEHFVSKMEHLIEIYTGQKKSFHGMSAHQIGHWIDGALREPVYSNAILAGMDTVLFLEPEFIPMMNAIVHALNGVRPAVGARLKQVGDYCDWLVQNIQGGSLPLPPQLPAIANALAPLTVDHKVDLARPVETTRAFSHWIQSLVVIESTAGPITPAGCVHLSKMLNDVHTGTYLQNIAVDALTIASQIEKELPAQETRWNNFAHGVNANFRSTKHPAKASEIDSGRRAIADTLDEMKVLMAALGYLASNIARYDRTLGRILDTKSQINTALEHYLAKVISGGK